MSAGAAPVCFIAGAVTLIVAGGGHVLMALRDTFRPTYFTPIDASVKPVVESTGIRLRGGPRPSMWRVWLGVHLTHGLSIFFFGLLCLLIAIQNLALVERIDALRPLAIAFSAALLAVSLRFFYYGPTTLVATATVCFTVAAVLSA